MAGIFNFVYTLPDGTIDFDKGYEISQFAAEKIKQNIGITSLTGESSKPGDFPYKRTGNLSNSINVSYENGQLIVDIYAEYASFLEYGTRKMASRPFVQRSLDEMTDEIISMMQ